MGAVSITAHDPQWVLSRLKSYSLLLNLSGELDLARLPLHKGFVTSKRVLDARLGITCPTCVEQIECRLDWHEIEVEGTIELEGQTSLFIPFETFDELPGKGQECRLRFDGGSIRVLVLSATSTGLKIVRAPSRVDKREFERKKITGLAIVHLPNGDSDADMFDISEGGIGLSTPFLVEIGTSVSLLLKLEGLRNIPFECEGVVTSCREVVQNEFGQHRVGIRFSSLPDSIRDEIRRFSFHE